MGQTEYCISKASTLCACFSQKKNNCISVLLFFFTEQSRHLTVATPNCSKDTWDLAIQDDAKEILFWIWYLNNYFSYYKFVKAYG